MTASGRGDSVFPRGLATALGKPAGASYFAWMHRFVFRWLVTSLVVAVVLYRLGSFDNGWLALIGAALFLGLLNALVRPLTLRLTETGLVLTTVLAVAALNGFFFGALGGFVPPYRFPNAGAALAGAAIVFL